jgi:hypothetical protein
LLRNLGSDRVNDNPCLLQRRLEPSSTQTASECKRSK